MTYYVAKVSIHEKGTNAYLFDAPNGVEAYSIASTLALGMNANLDAVMLLDEYMDGSILELCSF